MPDFIANAGGVICAAMEYAGATRSMAFLAIEEKIRANAAAGGRGRARGRTRTGSHEDAAIQHHVTAGTTSSTRTCITFPVGS